MELGDLQRKSSDNLSAVLVTVNRCTRHPVSPLLLYQALCLRIATGPRDLSSFYLTKALLYHQRLPLLTDLTLIKAASL